MGQSRITRIEWATLDGRRPRSAGCNSRLGEHGSVVRVPIVRLTTDQGGTGFGRANCDEHAARGMLGQPLGSLFDPARGVLNEWRMFEFPIWDLIGNSERAPV